MDRFKYANEKFRAKEYAEAIDVYRFLFSQNRRSVYQTNLLAALEAAHRKDNEKKEGTMEWRPSICFVTAGLMGPTLGGGIATCFYTMLEESAKIEGVQLTVIYAAHPYYGKGNFAYWKKHFREKFNAEFVVLTVNEKNYGSLEMKRSHAIGQYLELWDGLFDKVVFHDFMGLGYFSVVGKKLGQLARYSDLIVSAHGNHELSYYFGSKANKKWSEQAAMFMERKSVELADIVTTPSHYYADWWRAKTGREDFEVIQNIINSPSISREDGNANDAPITIYFYGRMERLKGIDVFIQVIRELSALPVFTDMKFVFAGNKTAISGVDSDKYVIERLNNFGEKVSFIYDISPDAFFSLASRSNGIVVFPTLGETSSCVVVEASLAGVPFLASDLPGIVELVHPDDYELCLFETGNCLQLLKKLLLQVDLRHVGRLSFNMEKTRGKWSKFFKRWPISPTVHARMTDLPLVSIVVPTCNRPTLLPKTLASLINQNYKNTEIIVVDDNSREWETNRRMCDELGVRYIHLTESRFKGAACNSALEYCKGEYVCFFDDDDLAYPNMIVSYMAAISHDKSIDVISCFADYFEHSEANEDGRDIVIDYVSLAIGNSLETNLVANFFGKGTFLVRKESFTRVGGYQVDTDMVPMVDYRFYVRASVAGLKMAIYPKSLYAYRKNSPSSLFYENKEKVRLRYLAKMGICSELRRQLGETVGRSLEPLVWNVSLPLFE